MIRHFSAPGLLLLIILFTSCGKQDEKIIYPEGFEKDSVISEMTMVAILSDVHMIESAMQMDRNKSVFKKEKLEFLYNGVFQKYHISRKRYEQNMHFYTLNPEVMSRVYARVVPVLEQRKELLSGKK